MKKVIVLLLAAVMVLGLAACASTTTDESSTVTTESAENTTTGTEETASADSAAATTKTLGVSYAYTNMAALQYQVTCYQEKCDERGWKLVLLDAANDVEQQIADVESLIQQKVDYMVIFPVDQTAGQSVVQEVKEAGIPLVFFSYPIDGTVFGEDYLSVATGDNKAQGAEAADFIHDNWEAYGFSGDVKYINLEGPVANACAEDRSSGFAEKAEEYGFVEVATQTADWSRSEAQQVVTNIIQSSGGDFNCIYSANEEMLFGAIAAMQQADMDVSTVMTIGVDATNEVCDAIKDGTMTGVVFYDQADLVDGCFRTFDKYENGEQIDEITGLTLDVICKDNVEDYVSSGKIVS